MWSSGEFLVPKPSFCPSFNRRIAPSCRLFMQQLDFIIQQTCTNTPGSYYCACREQGYQFNDRTGECEDINECRLGTHNCSTDLRCKNTDGSFLCKPKKTTTTTTTRFVTLSSFNRMVLYFKMLNENSVQQRRLQQRQQQVQLPQQQ